jgi:hypothetical protein
MSTFRNKVVAVTLVGSLGLASSVFACGGNRGGNGGGFGGGGYGGNGGNCNNGGIYNHGGYGNGGYNNFGQAYEPFHSSYVCQPGDSFYTVSLKEYGTSSTMKHIATFNRLATNTALVPGQRLLLPSISANGRLTQSRAPAAEVIANVASPALTAAPAIAATPATVAAAIATTSAPEVERMSVPTGSTLQLDGEKLGSDTGVVRLRISNVAFPVEVVEWSADSTKIRLPKLDVGAATKAELEVLRADGSLVSTNAIELTAPVTGLAATN